MTPVFRYNVIFLLLFAAFTVLAQDQKVNIALVNNQPFPVRMPVAVKVANLKGDSFKASNGKAIQRAGDELIFISDIPAAAHHEFNVQNGTAARTPNKSFVVDVVDNGIDLKFDGAALGRLSWQIIYRDSKPEELKGVPFSTKDDLSQPFQPGSIKFELTERGAVFDIWRGSMERSGLRLTIELRAFHDGFLDLNSELKNLNAAKTNDVYAAVVTRWQQQTFVDRSVCYDNRISVLKDNDWTSFRVGESRNWYVQRGVDWLKTNFQGNMSATWLNDFSESFTVHQDSTAKHPARWVGANIPQIGFEAQTKDNDVFVLTEIARSNLKSYAERLEDNRLMDRGEGVSFKSRLVFSKPAQSDQKADDAFVAYTSYAEQTKGSDAIKYSIGVPYTRFGTNYFPYSTLGENFDIKKLPGMDRDSYWPAAADTVNKWQLFADDIRRDLRIAKTLGFELIRLHHLELISGIEKQKRFEYLDFFLGEIRRLKLKVLIDARMSAEDTAEIVKRYRDVIDGVEVDNEVLIFGINDDAPDYWRRVYAAVKAVAPEIPVHLTAHTNTGAFSRLQKLGVPFDKIGQHAYADGLDSQADMRGFALAASSYGRRVEKEPIITEWNWRFLTRMTEDDRAKVYSPIFDNVLKTRSMPTMFQFQFNENLAMNPAVLKGIRHYEQLWLSRRPKPEAFVLSDLIKKYAAPTHPDKLIDIGHVVVELNTNGKGIARFQITNTSKRELELHLSVERSANLGVQSQSDLRFTLKPNQGKTVDVAIQALSTDDSPEPLPGFYHLFLRVDGPDGLLRYGWAEARLAGQPKIDAAEKTSVSYGANTFAFVLDRPLAVVYGDKAPIQDVETAYAVVNALESAIGRPVNLYELKDLPKEGPKNLILIGTAKTNQLIKQASGMIPANLMQAKRFVASVADDKKNEWLILSGSDNLEAERAAMDWTIRFWKYAKDSAARRIGLVEKNLPLGVDPQALP